jgi:hypothetical protein
MTKTQALRYLHRAEHFGFVAYHHGLIIQEVESPYNSKTAGLNWGISIECLKNEGQLFGHPQIIWDADQAERMFPGKTKKQ